MCEYCRSQLRSLYYQPHKSWESYYYDGTRGLKQISIKFNVPLSLLIARMKKGASLHDAVTQNKDTYTKIVFSEIVAKMKAPPSKSVFIPNTQHENDHDHEKEKTPYKVRAYQQDHPFPFPDKMSSLWKIALGLQMSSENK